MRWIAVTAILLVLVWQLADVLLIIFAALLIAIGLRGASEWVSRRTGLSFNWAMTLVALGAVAVPAAVLWWGGSSLADEAGQLGTQLQQQLAALSREVQATAWGKQLLHGFSGEKTRTGLDALAGKFAGAALGTFGVLGSILIVTVTAIYFAAQPDLYHRGFLRLVPIPYRERAEEVLAEIDETLRSWLVGRAIDMGVVIVLTFAGLAALGMPLTLVLALVAGLLNFVPYIGAFAGAVPAILVAFGQGPLQALWVGLLFFAIQMIEGYLLAPFIQQRTARLPPAITILSQTVFGTLFGLLGLLFAPALAAVILVAVRSLYVEDVLGDRAP